ncbi:MAG: DNA polymerase III subunit delta, partial [Planctomycetes bacterium]|nr:DNA polymerase III subunit delta [Planctomycetota bacterium]
MAKQPTANKPPCPIYVVHGPEVYLKDHALADVRHRALGADPDPLAYSHFGPNASLADVLDELRTLPLLAAYRLVIVADADDFIRAHREALERYCAKPSTSASLLLICNTFDKRTRLYKAVAATGRITTCEPLKGSAVTTWIVRQAQTVHHKRIDSRTAAVLRRLVGDELAMLDNELCKLSLYLGERPIITAPDVDSLIGCHREEKVFAVTDALDVGDVAGALSHWQQVLATDRAAPARALAGLAWGVRRLLEVSRQWRGGADLQALARSMYTDPQALRQRLQRVSLEQLESRQRDLLAADLDVKTGLTTVESAGRFQAFHAEEIIQLINMLEEMPEGMHILPELQYLVRRLDGTPHPLYAEAPAVAWATNGYIEFMESAFNTSSIEYIHRLIVHEKSHFLWENQFSEALKDDWITLGGWFEDPESSSGWSTTKQTEFVSAYAHLNNPNADMAESISFFIINPDL